MQRLIALLAIALLLVAGAQAADDTLQQTGNKTVVVNETFTPDGGNVTTLAESNRDLVYNQTVDVYANSAEVEDDGNYSWNAGNGTIRTVNNSFLDNQSSANITYGFSDNPEEQRDIAAVIGNLFGFGQWLVLIMGVGLAMMVARVLT